MVKIYVNLIKCGRKTIDDVPEKIKSAVQTALECEENENE